MRRPSRAELSDHMCRALTAHRQRWPSIGAVYIRLEGRRVVKRRPLHSRSLLAWGSRENPFARGSCSRSCSCIWLWRDVEQCPLISGIRAGTRAQPGEEIQHRLCRICSLRKRRARKGKLVLMRDLLLCAVEGEREILARRVELA